MHMSEIATASFLQVEWNHFMDLIIPLLVACTAQGKHLSHGSSQTIPPSPPSTGLVSKPLLYQLQGKLNMSLIHLHTALTQYDPDNNLLKCHQ